MTKEKTEANVNSQKGQNDLSHGPNNNVVTRPSLSYWQDALRIFKKNKYNLFSLGLVVFLFAFVVFGPFLWTISPSAQDLSRVAVAPTMGEMAVIVDEALLPPAKKIVEISPEISSEASTDLLAPDLLAPQDVHAVSPVSSMGVQIEWTPVAGASGYAVYRNEDKPEGASYGVPLAQISNPGEVSFFDNQSLEPKTYFYTVLAIDKDLVEATRVTTLQVDVPVGLSSSQTGLVAGQTLKMPMSPFGTDSLGRDVLARMMYGGRISLFIGLFASIVSIGMGILIGGISGYVGGRIDNLIMRITDLVMGLPFLLCMILLKVVLSSGPGESGITALLIALVVLSWTGSARLVRGQILQLRESEFVHAAKILGAKPLYIILRHMLPNIFGLILVSLTFGIPSAIFTEAFLSFIGLGVAAPATSWGSMCNDGLQALMTRPHEFLIPAFFISLTVLAFNLLGDGLRDALDPKLRSNE